jgi:hypothetical protein
MSCSSTRYAIWVAIILSKSFPRVLRRVIGW